MAPTSELNPREVIEARALLSALTEFSSCARHDLLGPMNQASSLLALFIRRNGGRQNSEAEEVLELLQSASARMDRLTAGIRKYMDVAGRTPCFEPVDLDVALSASLGILEKTISETAAVIVSDRLPVVLADPAHMVTILEILIRNSLRFRRADAPPVIRISPVREGGVDGIEVVDNGIGIDPESTESVLRPFRRLGGNPEPGLGLAIAKLIVELHGGRISINPASSGGGTVVRFTVQPA
jgi:signal transduction histidine kinase